MYKLARRVYIMLGKYDFNVEDREYQRNSADGLLVTPNVNVSELMFTECNLLPNILPFN